MFVTLTTDFGLSDAYVGAMKGVILSVNPHAQIVDLSHLVSPQNVACGAFILRCSTGFFPDGTVHVGVVDPGVGSARRGIVIQTARHFYVGPDNGLFSGALISEDVEGIYVIENRDLMQPDISNTFHGRDIFGPVGAHLANGFDVREVGRAIDDPVLLDLWGVDYAKAQTVGKIIHIDHFGNAISLIEKDRVGAWLSNMKVCVGVCQFDRVCATYADVEVGQALALWGSLNTLEISVRDGHAAHRFGLNVGDEIVIYAGE